MEKETMKCLEFIMKDAGKNLVSNNTTKHNDFYSKFLKYKNDNEVNINIIKDKKIIKVNRNNYTKKLLKEDDINIKKEILDKYNFAFEKNISFYSSNYRTFLSSLKQKTKGDLIDHRYNKIGVSSLKVDDSINVINNEYLSSYFDYIYGVLGSKDIREIDLYRKDLYKINDYNFTIEQAIHVITDTLYSLSPKYVELFKTIKNNGRIIFKKSGGSYCLKHSQCPYVVINWDGSLRSLIAFSHELGHAIFYYLNDKYYSVVESETYAKLFEHRLMRILLQDKFISISEYQKLEYKNLYGSCIRQTILHDFELSSINNTKKIDFSKEYIRIKKKYLSSYIKVEGSTSSQWARSSQIYSPLYSITYPMSYMLSKKLETSNPY